MTRRMGDATGANARALLGKGFDLIAYYATGLGEVPWSVADLAMFPGVPKVAIDQGAGASPNFSCTVMDPSTPENAGFRPRVEIGAYRPDQVPWWISNCTAPRPTVYCNRADLPAVLATGWRGDLWLAAPSGLAPAVAPAVPGCNVVAVQWRFAAGFDESAVFDPYWPLEVPVTKPAPAPPGLWNKCVCSGEVDGKLWVATFDAATGQWERTAWPA